MRADHPHARLLIVGEVKFAAANTRLDNRGYLAELHGLARELSLKDAVEFLGEREDAPEIMARADAILVPSIEEPFGRTVAEPMAVGTPVVATTVGGPAELWRTIRLIDNHLDQHHMHRYDGPHQQQPGEHFATGEARAVLPEAIRHLAETADATIDSWTSSR